MAETRILRGRSGSVGKSVSPSAKRRDTRDVARLNDRAASFSLAKTLFEPVILAELNSRLFRGIFHLSLRCFPTGLMLVRNSLAPLFELASTAVLSGQES